MQMLPDLFHKAREGRPCALCVGPGFVPGERRSDELVLRVLKDARCPVLVDGGALASIGTPKGVKRLQKRAKSGFSTVVTPHGGEAARLASALDVPATAPDLAQALQAVVVLKGPDTYISDGERTAVMCEGTAALAKAGTGDVLAGMIAALLAQGIDPFDAAVTGATVHARAGIAAAERLTSVSVVAEDLLDTIPTALATL